MNGFLINKYILAQVFSLDIFQILQRKTLMVVSKVGGLIFSICVVWQTNLGFGERAALQVAVNHLDLNTHKVYTSP